MIKFELEQDEAAFVAKVIGGLPTESNAFPVYQKLVTQFNAQAQKPAEEAQSAE